MSIPFYFKYRCNCSIFLNWCLSTLVILALAQTPGYAQDYPAQAPVSAKTQLRLETALEKSAADENRVRMLLALCNLHLNKPLKKNRDLETAKTYGEQARDLSRAIHALKGYTDAQLYLADIYTALNDFTAAEKLLPMVDDTARINIYLILSYRYEQRDQDYKDEDWRKALDFATAAIKLSIKCRDTYKKSLAQIAVGIIHLDQGAPSAESELLGVLAGYKGTGYPRLYRIYYQLAIFYAWNGKRDKALFYSSAALENIRLAGDTSNLGDLYVMQSTAWSLNGEYQKSIDYGNRAIASYRKRAGSYNLSDPRVFELITHALGKMNKYAAALDFLKKAMRDYPPQNVGSRIEYLSMTGHIYRGLKRNEEAQRSFLEAFHLATSYHIKEISANDNLGQLYVESHQFAAARPYLYNVLKFPQSMLGLGLQRHLRYMLFLADSATGHYLQAITHLNKFKEFDRVELAAARDKAVKELQIKFDVEKKEAEIQKQHQNIKLLEQKALFQQEKLQQQKVISNLVIMALVLFILVCALLFYLYKQKQNSNKSITEQSVLIARKNEMLEHLVKEKEWLLKEVHHRVKNNLHTIFCLLESQATHLENDALMAIENSQHRIYAMSLIHKRLYQTENIERVDMAQYLSEFVGYMQESFGSPENVRIITDVGHVNLNLNYAIPLALILNEALTNALKYAFPHNMPGQIRITLDEQDDQVTMIIQDNGKGMFMDQETEVNSFGLELMRGLTDDIRGKIVFSGAPGTTIKVSFDKNIQAED